MAIKALVSGAKQRYIIKAEREDSNPTVFIVRPMSARMRSILNAYLMQSVDLSSVSFTGDEDKDKKAVSSALDMRSIDVTQQLFTTFRVGVASVQNLVNDEGEAFSVNAEEDGIEIDGKKYPALPDNILDILPYDVVAEVSNAVSNYNKLGEEDKGKSDG